VRVVALGGGALLRRSVRLKALQRAVVVSLCASVATILERTAGDATRPLLPGAAEALEDQLALRSASYAEAHARVAVDGRSIDAICEDVRASWQRDPVSVAAGEASYSVEVGVDFADGRLASTIVGASRVILMTDENVGPLYQARYEKALSAAGVDHATIRWPAGEEHKT